MLDADETAVGDEYDQTVNDAARFFNVHVRTIQEWAKDGVLLGTRIANGNGFRWRFQRSEFHRLAEANANAPKEASA